jgi:HEAT repeat protein
MDAELKLPPSVWQVIPPLLQLLLDPDTDASVRDAAIGALEGAAQSDDARLLIGALGAVPVLVELVRAGRAPGATGAHTASAALAAGLLETLAVQPRNAEQMVEEGLPRELCGYLQQVPPPYRSE